MILPQWLSDKLSSPPEAGAGIHAWLFSCARQLHAHMAPQAVFCALQDAVANVGRVVPAREIRDAVNNSVAVAWQPKGTEIKRGGVETVATAERWPAVDLASRRARIRDAGTDGVTCLADLWEQSSIPDWTADEWLDWLFPGAEWLCLAGDHPATARTRRRERWRGGAGEYGLLVPSPMTAPSGAGLDGRRSHRCLDNTGPRRWLVVEFDSGTIDEQAALHWALRCAGLATPSLGWPRLTLCVHSAGKSLHGWYGPVTDEHRAHDLMSYARSIGADPATWVRCQLVRLPGGRRHVKQVSSYNLPSGFDQPSEFQTQEVFYFAPPPLSCLISSNNCTPPGNRLSTPRLESVAA